MAMVDRRDFLKLVGSGGIGAGAGFMLAESIKHPVEQLVPYPVPPEEFSQGIATWYNSVCRMCSAGCGISVRTLEGRAKKIEGNPAHPVNQGRLCALGQAGLQALYNPDRLTGPMTLSGERGSAVYDQTSWPEGIAALASRLAAQASNGGDGIAFLTQGIRGHVATLFDRFVGRLGSERLWHYDFDFPEALYAANERFFGERSLPYYDLENARYVLSFGADFLGRWISPVHHSRAFGLSRQGRSNVRGRFVQIEPRMSLSGAAADEWIPARPGTEGILALGIARNMVASGAYTGADREAWATALDPYTTALVAEQTGIPATTIERLAATFASTEPSLAIGGGGAGDHTNSVDALVAVNALNYLAGNLGQSGGVLFNPEPAFGPATNRRRASHRDMLALADDARAGRIQVLIVHNTNPVYSLPGAAFAEALAEIPFIVSLSSFMDETTAHADLILPSHTYLESWGDDTPEPGVGFPAGSISQPVVSPLYDTRAAGDIVLALARELGMSAAFPWSSLEDYLKARWREIHARAVPRTQSFDEFWTAVLKAGVWGVQTRRDTASFRPDPSVIAGLGVEPPEFAGADTEYPFVLHPYLSQAVHDGRGANLPWMQELPDPMTSVVYGSWVELNPVTAAELGLTEGDLVEVQSPNGTVTAPVFVFPAIMPDVIAMPVGQGHSDYGRYARGYGVNAIDVLAPLMEPVTGHLAASATRVRLNATGRRGSLIKTGGAARDLGRGIVQTASVAGPNARLNSIPITVEPA